MNKLKLTATESKEKTESIRFIRGNAIEMPDGSSVVSRLFVHY